MIETKSPKTSTYILNGNTSASVLPDILRISNMLCFNNDFDFCQMIANLHCYMYPDCQSSNVNN